MGRMRDGLDRSNINQSKQAPGFTGRLFGKVVVKYSPQKAQSYFGLEPVKGLDPKYDWDLDNPCELDLQGRMTRFGEGRVFEGTDHYDLNLVIEEWIKTLGLSDEATEEAIQIRIESERERQ